MDPSFITAFSRALTGMVEVMGYVPSASFAVLMQKGPAMTLTVAPERSVNLSLLMLKSARSIVPHANAWKSAASCISVLELPGNVARAFPVSGSLCTVHVGESDCIFNVAMPSTCMAALIVQRNKHTCMTGVKIRLMVAPDTIFEFGP
jgi:hypothetical protein